MAQVETFKRQAMQTEEIGALSLEPYKQRSELVDPGKRALAITEATYGPNRCHIDATPFCS